MLPLPKKDTLIIIPVFNEKAAIGEVINDLQRNYGEADILVVDDGSSDKTPEILKNKKVFVVTHLFNLGIGASFQTGCQFALSHNYSYIVRMDGDGQHNSVFINDILFPVKKGWVDIAIGSRFLGNSEFKSSFLRRIGISIISAILTLITKKRFTDPTSGFCAMNKRAYSFFAKSCVEDYPEPEILIHHRNFRITEIPITLMRRERGRSSITPLKSVYYMYKVLFSLFVSILRKERENEHCQQNYFNSNKP